jgi:glycosyltransferase involved in cell wall biosynthesis
MSPPMISVIMPVRDGQTFLDECIQSIFAQTVRDFEFIVVDDGSKDRTAEILRRHASQDPRLRIVTQAPAGIVAALNRAIEQSLGSMLARMDADDIAKPHRFARQIEVLSQHPSAAAVGSACEVIDRAGRVIRLIHFPTTPAQIRERLLQANCIAHPTVLMRRDAVLAAGGYRRAFPHCQDYDLWLRLSEDYDLLNIDDPLLRYRQHSGQATWFNLEERILSELGTQISARCRRAGEADPAKGLEAITRGDLRKFGMSDAEIDAQIVARALDAAREAARANNRRAAWEAFRLARRQRRLAWPIAARFWLACTGAVR